MMHDAGSSGGEQVTNKAVFVQIMAASLANTLANTSMRLSQSTLLHSVLLFLVLLCSSTLCYTQLCSAQPFKKLQNVLVKQKSAFMDVVDTTWGIKKIKYHTPFPEGGKTFIELF